MIFIYISSKYLLGNWLYKIGRITDILKKQVTFTYFSHGIEYLN